MKPYLHKLKAWWLLKWQSWDCDSACSLPRIFGIRKWFMVRFEEECKCHDMRYSLRMWDAKVASDFETCSLFASKGYICLAFGALAYFTVLGTPYWLWKKYKRYLC